MLKAQSTWIGTAFSKHDEEIKASWMIILYVIYIFNRIIIHSFFSLILERVWRKKGPNAPQQTSKNPYLEAANFCRRNLESFFLLCETPQRVVGQN